MTAKNYNGTGCRFYSLAEAKKYLKNYNPKYVSDPRPEDLRIKHYRGKKTWWVCTEMEWMHFH